jgi:glycerol-3-phosphate O-acyltransferase
MKINIIDYIPTGRDNAINRKQLCTITGLPDRLMRHEIEKARRDYAILNIDGSGYFRPADGEFDLIQKWLRQERNREKSVRDSTRGAEKVLLGRNREIVWVPSYTRRKHVGEDEKPQIEGQIKL